MDRRIADLPGRCSVHQILKKNLRLADSNGGCSDLGIDKLQSRSRHAATALLTRSSPKHNRIDAELSVEAHSHPVRHHMILIEAQHGAVRHALVIPHNCTREQQDTVSQLGEYDPEQQQLP